MKKVLVLILSFILITTLALINSPKKESVVLKDEEEVKIVLNGNIINKDIKKIAFFSDLHLQLGSVSDGISYIDSLGSDLIDAALLEAKNSDIDLLIVCGDNANSGKLSEHQELTNRLKAIKPDVEVIAINGNHDISSSVDLKEFEKLYYDLGYSNAFSKDFYSLSYSVIYNNLMIVMLDSDGYSDFAGTPRVKENTLEWLNAQLDYAKKNNINVVNVSHYPIIANQNRDFENSDKLLDLLYSYNVPLLVSGHLHYHSVNKYEGMKELVVEQITSYPSSYEILEIKDNVYTINSHKVDVQTYAKESGINDYRLLYFDNYLDSQFRLKCDDIIDTLVKDKRFYYKDVDNAKNLFFKVMKYRSDGNLIDHKEEILNHEGYQAFLKISDGTIWAKWIPVVLDEANELTKGFKIDLNERD